MSLPIHEAAKKGDVQALQLQINGGVGVNTLNPTVGATPLVYAAQAGHTEAVKLLLSLRAQTDITTRKGKTALMVARDKGHAAVVALLEGEAASSQPGPVSSAPSSLGSFGGFGASLSLGGSPAPAGAFGSNVATSFGGGVASTFGATPTSAFGTTSPTTSAAAAAGPASPFCPPAGGGVATGGPFSSFSSVPSGSFGFNSAQSAGTTTFSASTGAFGGGISVPTGFGGLASGPPKTTKAIAPSAAVGGQGPEALSLPTPPEDSVSDVIFGGPAHHVAASSWDGSVRVWKVDGDGRTADHLLTYTHAAPALCVGWSHGASALFSGGAEGLVRSVNLTRPQLQLVGEHQSAVSALATTTEQPSCVLSASHDGCVAVWDVRTSGQRAATVSLGAPVHSLDLQWPRALAGTSTAGAVSMIDLRQPAPVVETAPLQSNIKKYAPRCVKLFPRGLNDGNGFCTGSFEGRVGIHFFGTPQASAQPANAKWGEDFQFKCHRHSCDVAGTQRVFAVNAVSFHPKKPELLATAGSDGEAVLWDVRQRKRVQQLAAAPASGLAVCAMAFSAGGEMLALARSDDWTGGEARSRELSANGARNEICVIPLAHLR